MQNLLLRRILPHWDSVGVCNNNLCTHCFLGETHQDGILDKQQNSQGSWTPAISYPWKMNGHSKATGNQTICVTVAGNEIFACPECWKASEGFTNRNGQRRQSYSACHTGDVTKVWVFPPQGGSTERWCDQTAVQHGDKCSQRWWGTSQLPCSVMANPETTLCCSPAHYCEKSHSRDHSASDVPGDSVPKCCKAPARLLPAAKTTLSRLLTLSSSTGRTILKGCWIKEKSPKQTC